MSSTSPRASWPEGHATSVHWIQARKAFEPGSRAFPARLVESHDAIAVVERPSDGGRVTLVIGRPDELAATLARFDVTRWDGAPLVLVIPGYGVLAVATGPATPPAQLTVLASVARVEDGAATGIPAVHDADPSWTLFAAKFVPTDEDE